jgi:pantetheine-phosphate adenylyltransferase
MTNGHLDVLRAAVRSFDRVVIAIGIHPGKQPLFTFEERKALIEAACKAEGLGTQIEVLSFDGLLIDAAYAANANVLLRGLRDGTDFDYEMHMAGMNAAMAPQLQTLFVPASKDARTITATLVRQINAMGGNVDQFVPSNVHKALLEKRKKH